MIELRSSEPDPYFDDVVYAELAKNKLNQNDVLGQLAYAGLTLLSHQVVTLNEMTDALKIDTCDPYLSRPQDGMVALIDLAKRARELFGTDLPRSENRDSYARRALVTMADGKAPALRIIGDTLVVVHKHDIPQDFDIQASRVEESITLIPDPWDEGVRMLMQSSAQVWYESDDSSPVTIALEHHAAYAPIQALNTVRRMQARAEGGEAIVAELFP